MRSVVTDDAGRYVIPDLPAASYRVWVRGYGLADSAKTAAQLGQQVNITATVAPDAATAAQGVSGHSLVRDDENSGGQRTRRHRSRRPEPVLEPDEEHVLCRLPSARQSRHAHDSQGAWGVRVVRRSLAAPDPVRTGRAADDPRHRCASSARYPSSTWRTGPTGSLPANCPPRRPNDPRASNAMS